VSPNSTLARVIRVAALLLAGVAALCPLIAAAATAGAGYLSVQGLALSTTPATSALGATYVMLSLLALSVATGALILTPILAAGAAILTGFAARLEAAPTPSWPQMPGWPQIPGWPQVPGFPPMPSLPPFQLPGLPPLPTPPPFPWIIPCCCCGKTGDGVSGGFPVPPPWGGMDPKTFMRLWLETAKAFLEANAKRVQGELKRVEDAIHNAGDKVDEDLKKAQDALREEAERLRKLGNKVEDAATTALAQSVIPHRP
jgi:hypothetical protein